jgi:hypothetical protein
VGKGTTPASNRKERRMQQDRAACTIIAKNYVAFARTLAQSFLSFHPGSKFYALVVDDFEGHLDPTDECFEIVRLGELNIPNLPGFCFKYDVKELCTAAKAHLLDYLLREKSVGKLLYLDPDILVTGRLDALYEQLDVSDIVLTPHLDADYPDDGLLPDDGYILRAGQFNLGFIGVNASDNAKSFLEWWKPKLYRKCIVDLQGGYFVDQKYVDFAPIFFENVFIERGVGYNIAYWNLHSRRVGRANGAWTCNGGPLYFFHFSGHAPGGAEISSHIPASVARHRLSNRPDLRELFDEYDRLVLGHGHREASSWPYTFERFRTGERIPPTVRRFYLGLPAGGRGLGDPFESERLKRMAGVGAGPAIFEPALMDTHGAATTAEEQLHAILNSRAWRWVCRYGRFKNRYLSPAREFCSRLFGGRRTGTRQTENR